MFCDLVCAPLFGNVEFYQTSEFWVDKFILEKTALKSSLQSAETFEPARTGEGVDEFFCAILAAFLVARQILGPGWCFALSK